MHGCPAVLHVPPEFNPGIEGYRRLVPPRIPDAEARQVMLDAGLEPLEPYPGSHSQWKCRCLVCGAEVRPHYSSVKSRRFGSITLHSCRSREVGVRPREDRYS